MVKKSPYNSDLKLKIVLKFLSNNKTSNEICQEHGVSKSALHKWSGQLKSSANLIYSVNNKNSKSKDDAYEQKLSILYKKIGELSVERDFLKKVSDS